MSDRKSSLLDFVGSLFSSPAHATFLGENTPGADKKALSRARKMEDQGRDRDAIWKSTGYYKTKDGKWMYEVSDDAAELRPWAQGAIKDDGGATSARMIDVMDHPALYTADPSKASARVRLGGIMDGRDGPDSSVSGLYDESTDTTHIYAPTARSGDALSTLLHESQHRASDRAKMDYGPTDEIAITDSHTRDMVARNLADLRNQIADAKKRGDADAVAALTAELGRPIRNHMAEQSLFESYRRRQGEVQARNVETRRTMSPEERWARPPWLTEDVPWSLVRITQKRRPAQ